MKGIKKSEVLRKLRAGYYLYRRVTLAPRGQYHHTAVVKDFSDKWGENVHGRTSGSIDVRVAHKFINGEEQPADYVPCLENGDVYEIYYTLADSSRPADNSTREE